MPPLAIGLDDVRALVRKLGASARPSQQQAGAEAIARVLFDCVEDRDGHHTMTAIVSAGAIPSLARLISQSGVAGVQVHMQVGSYSMQVNAASALYIISMVDENRGPIAAAGAIPPLVQLLSTSRSVTRSATGALRNLAQDADIAVTIAAAGAITPLVVLLGATDVMVQQSAAGALRNLARVAAVTIAAAGAIPPLAQLSRSDTTTVAAAAGAALDAIRAGIAANRAAVAAARASAELVQAMEGAHI
jgi:predicted metalloprotease with PDZ domain